MPFAARWLSCSLSSWLTRSSSSCLQLLLLVLVVEAGQSVPCRLLLCPPGHVVFPPSVGGFFHQLGYHLVPCGSRFRLTQRIYIYREGTAPPFVCNTCVFFRRKPEAVRKTTPELLSAVLRIIFLGEGVECNVLY